jgi:hypothetical protein
VSDKQIILIDKVGLLANLDNLLALARNAVLAPERPMLLVDGRVQHSRENWCAILLNQLAAVRDSIAKHENGQYFLATYDGEKKDQEK